MKGRLRPLAGLVFSMLAALAATAQPFKTGDVVAIRVPDGLWCGECFMPRSVSWFSNDASPLATVSAGSGFSVRPPVIGPASEAFFAADSPYSIRVLDTAGQQVREIALDPHTFGWTAVGQDGTLFVVNERSIAVLDDHGNVLRQYAPSFPPGSFFTSLDLAADECTLLMVSAVPEGIARFNACTREVLTPWPSPAVALRALADGGAAVVMTDGESGPWVLRLLDSDGATGGDIPLPVSNTQRVSRIAFDADPHYLWLGLESNEPSDPMLIKVDLRTRGVVASAPRDGFLVGFDVYGETRPALAGILPADVPALSQWVLIALGAVLAAVALRAAA